MPSATLPYMKNSPKIIFFTDFDGTITLKDSNDYMTDNLGFGPERRAQGNRDVLDGKRIFRDSFREMLESINTPFDECIRILTDAMKLDPYFIEFYHWTKSVGIPIVVLSSGMVPIIRALLTHGLGFEPDSDHLHIVANEVIPRECKTEADISTAGGWTIKYHDESGFGHDKSREIKPYAALPANVRPILLYAGDGVSDLSAARETDLLFAKKGQHLVTYCHREKIPHTLFEDWSSILQTTKDLYEGKATPKSLAVAEFKEEQVKGVDAVQQ
ncbi:hypothetical protein KEM56_002133 [Ascosphaera pollenicola]|nr:hypothetical protein KEM56_002133 [Ascosphaera pollenicola]